jgi:hypothetical protein
MRRVSRTSAERDPSRRTISLQSGTKPGITLVKVGWTIQFALPFFRIQSSSFRWKEGCSIRAIQSRCWLIVIMA